MTLSVTHNFVSARSNGTDNTQVQPSNWNDQHVLTCANARVLGNASGSAGNVQELDLTNSTTRTNLGLLVSTAWIVDANVTWQKFQNLPALTLMGNASSVATSPEPIVIGAGLAVTGINVTGAANNGSGLIRLTVTSTSGWSTGDRRNVSGVTGTTEANGGWTITVVDGTHIDLQNSTFTNAYISGGTVGTTLVAPAFTPPAVFKNLKIVVASNTTVTASADYITVTDGTTFQTLVFGSATINLGTNGAANALDTGTIATSTWYAIWAIAKADGTTAWLASTSATSPTMPSGYTFKARMGWVRTIASSATLYGTLQYGRRAQYVVGLAQTTIIPIMVVGVAGTYSTTSPVLTSVSVTNFVPTATASEIIIITSGGAGGIASGGTLVAPNSSWGGTNNGPEGSNGVCWPFWIEDSVTRAGSSGSLILESANIYWAAARAGCSICCLGWIDNI